MFRQPFTGAGQRRADHFGFGNEQRSNTGNGTREITIDANLPGLRLTPWRAMTWSILSSMVRRWCYRQQLRSGSGQQRHADHQWETYVAAVLADGTWSVGVPAVMSAPGLRGRSRLRRAVAPPPKSGQRYASGDCRSLGDCRQLNAITADDVINAAEKGAALTSLAALLVSKPDKRSP